MAGITWLHVLHTPALDSSCVWWRVRQAELVPYRTHTLCPSAADEQTSGVHSTTKKQAQQLQPRRQAGPCNSFSLSVFNESTRDVCLLWATKRAYMCWTPGKTSSMHFCSVVPASWGQSSLSAPSACIVYHACMSPGLLQGKRTALKRGCETFNLKR